MKLKFFLIFISGAVGLQSAWGDCVGPGPNDIFEGRAVIVKKAGVYCACKEATAVAEKQTKSEGACLLTIELLRMGQFSGGVKHVVYAEGKACGLREKSRLNIKLSPTCNDIGGGVRSCSEEKDIKICAKRQATEAQAFWMDVK